MSYARADVTHMIDPSLVSIFATSPPDFSGNPIEELERVLKNSFALWVTVIGKRDDTLVRDSLIAAIETEWSWCRALKLILAMRKETAR